jgi:hypothetical protein
MTKEQIPPAKKKQERKTVRQQIDENPAKGALFVYHINSYYYCL